MHFRTSSVRKRLAFVAAATAAAVPILSDSSEAAVKYFNPADATGPASGGSGAFDNTSTNWSDNGATINQVLATTDDAILGTVGGAVAVDLAGATANSLTFNVGGYTLTGGQVTVGSNVTTRLVNTSGTNTISGNVGFSGRRGGANVSAGRLNILGDVVRTGTAGNYFEFKKTGAGTVAVYGGFTSSLGSEFPTLVQQGTMLVNSPSSNPFAVSATGSLNVSNGATIGGTGVFRGNGQAGIISPIDGNVSPGDPTINGGVGTFTFEGSSFDLAPTSTLFFDLAATDTVGAGVNDLVQINTFGFDGSLKLDGILNITAYQAGVLENGGSYRLFNYPTVSTHLSHVLFVNDGIDLANSILPAGYTYAIDTSTLGQVNLIVTAIPEPGSMALLGLGVGALLARRRLA